MIDPQGQRKFIEMPLFTYSPPLPHPFQYFLTQMQLNGLKKNSI